MWLFLPINWPQSGIFFQWRQQQPEVNWRTMLTELIMWRTFWMMRFIFSQDSCTRTIASIVDLRTLENWCRSVVPTFSTWVYDSLFFTGEAMFAWYRYWFYSECIQGSQNCLVSLRDEVGGSPFVVEAAFYRAEDQHRWYTSQANVDCGSSVRGTFTMSFGVV